MANYLLRGWFVAPDVKHSGSVEATVERATRPTEAEATEVLLPLAEADVARSVGETYQCSFTGVTIEEQDT